MKKGQVIFSVICLKVGGPQQQGDYISFIITTIQWLTLPGQLSSPLSEKHPILLGVSMYRMDFYIMGSVWILMGCHFVVWTLLGWGLVNLDRLKKFDGQKTHTLAKKVERIRKIPSHGVTALSAFGRGRADLWLNSTRSALVLLFNKYFTSQPFE